MRYLKFLAVLLAVMLLCGCGPKGPSVDISATTGPVAQFTLAVTEGTGLTVTQVVTDSVSCLHDYSLSVGQLEAIASSRVTVVSGGGLEDTMEDALNTAYMRIDCSKGTAYDDPHFWLDPAESARMVDVICDQLSTVYPVYAPLFRLNADKYKEKLDALQAYGQEQLAELSCRELVTFHDGFGCMAKAFDLEIAAAIEEEAGAEASAQSLIDIIGLIEDREIPAVFTEKNGSDAAASLIAAETGVSIYALDMALSGDYLDAMYHNINTLKEALS